ncbi:retrovirus-related pol polyprotein from transposon TNT 1-94 [Tanacetum coccineum]
MTGGDERKHVLDYTHVDLHYVDDQRKNLLSKFSSLKQELSLCKSELIDVNNTKAYNISIQNEITRLNLGNESLKDEVSNLKKVIEKWNSSKVTLYQLLTKQVPGNIVRALGRRGRREETISSKEVVFTKEEKSPSDIVPEVTFDTASECYNQEPLPPFPKLSGAEPIDTLNDAIKKKAQTKSSSVLDPCRDKKANSSTKQFLLTLMKEEGSKIPKPFIPYKYCRFNDHHFDKCEYYPGCDICGSIAYELSNCDKKTLPNNRRPRIANKRSNKPTKNRKMENLNDVKVKDLRSDNGMEFMNNKLEEICDEKGISQNFSSPCTLNKIV